MNIRSLTKVFTGGTATRPHPLLKSLRDLFANDSVLTTGEVAGVLNGVRNQPRTFNREARNALETAYLELYRSNQRINNGKSDGGRSWQATYDGLQALRNFIDNEAPGILRANGDTGYTDLVENHQAAYPYRYISGGQLFVDGCDFKDVKQGQQGDCYLMAALSAAALVRSSRKELINIEKLPGELFVVPIYHQGEWRRVKVDAEVIPEYARSTNSKELWVSLVEKAAVEVNHQNYTNIGKGGSVSTGIEMVTGHRSDTKTVASTSADELWRSMTSGKTNQSLMVAGTLQSLPRGDAGDFRPAHAYAVVAVAERGGKRYVKLYNPHASGEPYSRKQTDAALARTDDGHFEIDFDTFRRVFDKVAIERR